MPQNIDNYGLALLMLSSKKQREGKGCVEDATKKPQIIKSRSENKRTLIIVSLSFLKE